MCLFIVKLSSNCLSSLSGVQGHYLVNTSGQTDEEPETQLLAAPCLANFFDEASPPVFTLMFKWVYASGKMYALTIPTDLKLSGGTCIWTIIDDKGSSCGTETYKATTLFYGPDIDLRHV